MFNTLSQSCIDNLILVGVSSALIAAIAAGLAVYLIWVKRDPSPNYNEKVISNEEALELIQNYRNHTIGDPKESNPDITISGHIELNVLLDYIDKMKKRCGEISRDMSGIEYYFAKYANDVVKYKEDAGRPTIVMYPTYVGTVDGETGHIPFDPFLTFSNNEPISVSMMNRTDANRRSDADKLAWYNSNHVLNRSNMSPPRKPNTL